MLPKFEAERLAWAVLGTAWESRCLATGLDPFQASADDILGPMSTRIRDNQSTRVLHLGDVPEGAEQLQDKPESTREFMAMVALVAGLTRQERRVTQAIVEGSPIPDGKNYSEPIAKRLRTTPTAIRNAWARAKKKLQESWTA